MLLADNISIRFGAESVLDRFSCHIGKGEFACITGVSGCGKTSLLKSFIGLTPLADGVVSVGNCVLDEHTCSAIRKRVAYLPQDLSLPYETVQDAIKQIFKVGDIKDQQAAMVLLKANMLKLGLDHDLLDKHVSEMSGGQRQRLMLAALSLLDREVWLLDEPTAALDMTSRDDVINFLVEQLCSGKTIVAVSHDAYFSSRCSVRIQL